MKFTTMLDLIVTDDILAMYDALNESIIGDVARRIVKTGMVTETAAWQMKQAQEMGALYEDEGELIWLNAGL